MKNIKILGTGCQKCQITTDVIKQAVKENSAAFILKTIGEMAELFFSRRLRRLGERF